MVAGRLWLKERLRFSCKQCGAAFFLLASQVAGQGGRSPRGVFCSKACNGLWKRHGSTLECKGCGKSFYRHFAEQDLETSKRQFCSRPCYFKARVDARKVTTYPKIGPTHEHRLVASRVLKRRLRKGEVVHHGDENKHNNDPGNLYLFPSQRAHSLAHKRGISDEELRRFSLVQVARREARRHRRTAGAKR